MTRRGLVKLALAAAALALLCGADASEPRSAGLPSADAGVGQAGSALSYEDLEVLENLELLENMDQFNDLELLQELAVEG